MMKMFIKIFKHLFLLDGKRYDANLRFYENLNINALGLSKHDTIIDIFVMSMPNKTKNLYKKNMFINFNGEYFDNLIFYSLILMIMILPFLYKSFVWLIFIIPLVYISLCLLLNFILTYKELMYIKKRLCHIYKNIIESTVD